MKIALYIEDGLEQIVLTPETETERGVLSKLHDGERSFEMFHGAFYGCRGGWVRHSPHYTGMYDHASSRDDDSTMIVLRPKEGQRES